MFVCFIQVQVISGPSKAFPTLHVTSLRWAFPSSPSDGSPKNSFAIKFYQLQLILWGSVAKEVLMGCGTTPQCISVLRLFSDRTWHNTAQSAASCWSCHLRGFIQLWIFHKSKAEWQWGKNSAFNSRWRLEMKTLFHSAPLAASPSIGTDTNFSRPEPLQANNTQKTWEWCLHRG